MIYHRRFQALLFQVFKTSARTPNVFDQTHHTEFAADLPSWPHPRDAILSGNP